MSKANFFSPSTQFKLFMNDVFQAKHAWTTAKQSKSEQAYTLGQRLAIYAKVAFKTIAAIAFVATAGLAIGYAACHAIPAIATVLLTALAIAGLITLGALLLTALASRFAPFREYLPLNPNTAAFFSSNQPSPQYLHNSVIELS